MQKVFKDNKVLISERNDNNQFAVSIHGKRSVGFCRGSRVEGRGSRVEGQGSKKVKKVNILFKL